MSPENMPDHLRKVAREAFAGRPPMSDGVFALPSDRNPWRALDDALAAVLPAHEAFVRAKVSDEIEMENSDPNSDYDRGLYVAARIARGERK